MARPRPARPSRSRRRVVGVALAVVGLAGLGTASAAQLNVSASTLAAGSAQVGDCQGTAPLRVQLVSGWEPAENPDAYATTAVIVHNVASACIGQSLRVTLVAANDTALREVTLASITIAGTQPSLGLTSRVLTSTVVRAEVVIHS